MLALRAIMFSRFICNYCLLAGIFAVSGCSLNLARNPSDQLLIRSRQSEQINGVKLVKGSEDLLVGLQPYLGRGTTLANPSRALHLISNGRPLRLIDSKGIVHIANEIKLSWETVLLSSPKNISRLVAGPFASFESAERFQTDLKKHNIISVVAHPNDWEVWLSRSEIDSDLNQFFLWKKVSKIIYEEVQPVLKVIGGEIGLTGPLKIEAPDGIKWNGGIYLGPFSLISDAYGSWTFIEKVPIERYLTGVVPHEIGFASPEIAMSVQAVLARTWALANRHRFAIDGYELCSDTQCQVYKNPDKASNSVKSAIAQTAGRILTWGGHPIHAVYHASNGGVMASANEAWSMKSLPYFKAKLDGSEDWQKNFRLPLKSHKGVQSFLMRTKNAYGTSHNRFRWTRLMSAVDLQKALQRLSPNISLPKKLTVLERGPSGRVIELEILTSDNQSLVLRLDSIRRNLRVLPSTLFVINEVESGIWKFSGGGFGHGVGLSQAGAIDLAQKGWSINEILMHYYPGTTYEPLQQFRYSP